MTADTGIVYSPDSIDPEYNVGFGLNIGGGAPASVSVSGGATNQPGATPGCLTCGNGLMGISWPVVILAIAALVLFLRK